MRAILSGLVTACVCLLYTSGVQAQDFQCFNTQDINEPDPGIPLIEPWRVVQLDPEYGGQWVVAGDLDGDGQVDIVSAENVNNNDTHYTSTAVAQKLDGTVLWRWGSPDVGRKTWHHDVACQIHDWDGDGEQEVVLSTEGFVVALDGKTGRELKRLPIPQAATDCLVFCKLSETEHASDILVKDRYHQIWAFDRNGKLLWTVRDPGGFRAAHQPRPMDIDGDGRDEIMAGYALLNSDGSVRWVFKSEKVDQSRGHLDCARILRQGKSPEDVRIVLTCCGANNIAMINGNGKILWEQSGHHFESIDIGPIMPRTGAQSPGLNILVDIDHQPYGQSPMLVLGEQGQTLGQIIGNYSRHHGLLDWDGDGLCEIIVAHNGALYNYQGQRVSTLHTPGLNSSEKPKYERSMLLGDMTGDGARDLILTTPETLYIYKNTHGKKGDCPLPLGTVTNFTLY
jgi:outer membrane protein assembly factor BamB